MSSRHLNKNNTLSESRKKKEKCQFYSLDRPHTKLVNTNIPKEKPKDGDNPGRKLVDLISDLEKEEAILKETEEKNNYEIQILKQVRKTKDRKIEKMNAEMLAIKLEKEKLEQELEKYHNSQKLLDTVDNLEDGVMVLNESGMKSTFEVQILRQVQKSRDKKIEQMNIEMEKIQAEKNKMAHQLDIVKKQLGNKISEMTTQINYRREGNPISTQMTLTRLKESLEGKFTWTIDEVEKKRKDGELIVSEYFYPKDDPYKLRLSLGCYGKNLEIRLLVYSGSADAKLRWPFQANVTIRIINRLQPGAARSLEKYREMTRPPEKLFKSSDQFVFGFDDLFLSGLLQGDLFVVECSVTITKREIK